MGARLRQGDLRWLRACNVIGLAENKFAWCEASCLQRRDSDDVAAGTRVLKLTASSVATPVDVRDDAWRCGIIREISRREYLKL